MPSSACVVGQCSVETLGNVFAPTSRRASSNYGIGYDGRIGMYVEEKDRSWCSSSASNDNRAITIEVASDTKHPYKVRDAAYNALIDLCTDICKRNGIKRLVWSTSKNDRVNHLNGCNMTVHRDYANKSCPGDYLYNRHGQIAAEVNKRLGITDAGGSTGGQTSGNTETGLKVGDVVNLKGTQHYTSAAAKDAKTCKPGKATITVVAAGKAHPYHLKAISGGGSTVYGWVNAADISTGSTGTATSYRVRTTADVLNIRKGPGTNYGILCSVEDGDTFPITGKTNGWYQILCNGRTGYVSAQYAKVEDSDQVSKPDPDDNAATNPEGNSIVAAALQYVGYPYVYGTAGPETFDCSGFTSYIYKQFGVTLNRSSKDQVNNGVAVSKSNLQQGDLVFFSTNGVYPTHVGIYIGDGNIVHASTAKDGVKISSLNTSYYTTNYFAARRIV